MGFTIFYTRNENDKKIQKNTKKKFYVLRTSLTSKIKRLSTVLKIGVFFLLRKTKHEIVHHKKIHKYKIKILGISCLQRLIFYLSEHHTQVGDFVVEIVIPIFLIELFHESCVQNFCSEEFSTVVGSFTSSLTSWCLHQLKKKIDFPD